MYSQSYSLLSPYVVTYREAEQNFAGANLFSPNIVAVTVQVKKKKMF